MLFAPRQLHCDTRVARQSCLSVIPYQEVNFDWFSKNPSFATELYASGLYASDLTAFAFLPIVNYYPFPIILIHYSIQIWLIQKRPIQKSSRGSNSYLRWLPRVFTNNPSYLAHDTKRNLVTLSLRFGSRNSPISLPILKGSFIKFHFLD